MSVTIKSKLRAVKNHRVKTFMHNTQGMNFKIKQQNVKHNNDGEDQKRELLHIHV